MFKMSALTPLISAICNPFDIHPSRKKTLAAIIYGVMETSNVHQISLSRHLSTKNPKNALRRVERFFQKEDLDWSENARSMVGFLRFTGKFDLCLDRTNWKFGEKDINYLVLSWRLNKHVSLPLFAVELNKAGNSNTQERIELLELFAKAFSFDRIGSLLADREFIGDAWFKKLIEWGVPFFIRVKENGLVPYGDEPIHVKILFDHLKPGKYRIVEKEMYGTTVYFAGTRAKAGDLVIVISNQDWKPKKILDQYRKRWSIEEMFKKLKTSGFHWENTHMKISSRLLTLLIIMTIASTLLYCMGLDTKTTWKKTLKCPLWSLFTRGKIRFQKAAANGVKAALKVMFRSMAHAEKLWAL